MGVHGLWKALAPVGRRVDVQTLQGKVLAVDASIWLTQFIKAMRSKEDGRMIHNAHILGSLRRILKLLANKIKPLFVFDGGVPVLKRRIREARRAKADFNERMLKRAAQKLLLNQMLLREVSQAQQAHKAKLLPGDARTENAPETSQPGIASGFNMPKARPGVGAAATSTDAATKEQNADDDDDDDDDDEDLPLGISWSQAGAAQPGKPQDAQAPKTVDLVADIEAATASAAKADDDNNNNVKSEVDNTLEDDIFADSSEQVEEIIAQLPVMADGTVDTSSIGVLPKRLQYEVIALLKDKRRQRESKRNEFIPVAGDPRQYSAMQLSHFLKDVNLKKRLDNVESNLAKASGAGKRIASDARVQYVLKDKTTDQSPGVTPTHQQGVKGQSSTLPPVPNSSTLDKILAQKPGKHSQEFFKMQAANHAGTYTGHSEEALSKAMNTASHLTSWAANAVRSAVRKRKAAALAAAASSAATSVDPANPTVTRVTLSSSSSSFSSSSAFPAPSRSEERVHEVVDINDSDSDSDSDFAPTVSAKRRRKVLHDVDDVDDDDDVNKEEEEEEEEEEEDISEVSKHANVVKSASTQETEKTSGEGPNQKTDNVERTQPAKSSDDARSIDRAGDASSKAIVVKNGDDVVDNDDDDVDDDDDDDDDFLDSIQFEEPPKAPPLKSVVLRLPSNHLGQRPTKPLASSTLRQRAIKSVTDASVADDKVAGDEAADLSSSVAPDARKPGSEHIDLASEAHDVDGDRDNLDQVEVKLASRDVDGEDAKVASDTEAVAARSSGDDAGSGRVASESDADAALSSGNDVEYVEEEAVGTSASQEEETKVDGADSFVTPEKDVNHLATESDDLVASAEAIEVEEALLRKEEENAAEIRRLRALEEKESDEDRERRLRAARSSLVQENENLMRARYSAQRDSETVTPAMLEDVKELLRLFGLPYVEAPMEAEAECAELELSGIVDGVVTDDCDAFLFGARNVYKNIFDDRKYVEAYKTSDVEKELGMNRKDMIHMALLLGSDYTTGIKGIGIVNASEVVHAFPNLADFRKWVNSPPELESGQSADTPAQREFKRSHRKAREKWVVPEQFPSLQVVEAYEKPIVAPLPNDFRLEFKDPEEAAIRRYCAAKLGWSDAEAHAQIERPLRAFRERGVQSTLDSFVVSYNDGSRFAAVRSKRLQNVIKDKSVSSGGRKVRFVNAVGVEIDGGGTKEAE